VDLTKVEARIDLRRPKATSPITPGLSGSETDDCPQDFPHIPQLDAGTQKASAHSGVALRASLVSLDRTHYQVGDTSEFEVTVENTGSGPIRIPFSPHLADLQPKDPTQKFSYSELQIVLWIAGGVHWSAGTGSVSLVGGDDHPGTMLSLKPGQWARIIGEARFIPLRDLVDAETIRSYPVDRVYATASVYRDQTLISATQSATVRGEICVAHPPGQLVPIQLTIP
jgi:hypothetical protein